MSVVLPPDTFYKQVITMRHLSKKCQEVSTHYFIASYRYRRLDYYTHSHSANTHHRALRSASTSPLHVPRSPTLMTVSQVDPRFSAFISSISLLATYSCFLVRRMILPLGDCIASLAGFCCLSVMEPSEKLDPELDTLATAETMLIALLGRA